MEDSPSSETGTPDRRGFLSSVTSWFMAGGLVTGYGACAATGARYLFPARPRARSWLFVARADELRAGDSIAYRSPSGEKIAIARQGETGTSDDFIALSSTCPHLGCQVHWEGANNRFFCPCHNGIFDPSGNPLGGPPAEAQQSLPRFPLKVEGGLLYIDVPVEALADAEGRARPEQGGRRLAKDASPPGPGHDPCLHPSVEPTDGDPA